MDKLNVRLCRVCLLNEGTMSVFGNFNQNVIANMIMAFTSIKVCVFAKLI